MSQRRKFLLGLLVIPAICLYLNLSNPTSPGDQHNGLEIISLVISLPIIFLNILEWQQPETLDNLLKPGKSAPVAETPAEAVPPEAETAVEASGEAPAPAATQNPANNKLALIAIGGLITLCLGSAVFGAVGQAFDVLPTETPRVVLDVGAIQTAAVQTALADLGGPNPPPAFTPQPTSPQTGPENASPTPEVPVTNEPIQTPQTEATATSPAGVPPTATIPPVTQAPSNTPQAGATDTIEPTDSPIVQPTENPIPDPILLTGVGDTVVNIAKWNGPAVLTATHDGDGAFQVTSYSQSNQKINELVNTLGVYYGTLPLDFLDTEHTARFDVTASGSWELQVISISQARTEESPGIIQGYGDEVIILTGQYPVKLLVDAPDASGSFVIWSFAIDRHNRALLVNKTAPYSGILLAPSGTAWLAITATGPWSIELTSK
jgi:hypothetical protein